ncbi:MAG: oligosaccharide flippase family protein [Ignavibacteriae bacterium]|nr:oligosaccharide flippase family protein [Ignavibacteriota bacterium]
MEFGKHITKGIWAFADKALPAIYGVAYIFLVIRVLPEQEYGAFVIVQTLFAFVTALGFALAFQPFTKFAAETEDYGPFAVASVILSGGFYLLVSAAILLFQPALVPIFDPAGSANISSLLKYVPLLLVASLYRSYAISLLQTTYQVQKIFWIDAAYFLGTIVLILLARELHRFNTAEDIVKMNLLGISFSSLLSIALTFRSLKGKYSFQKEAFWKMVNFGKFSFGGNAVYTVFSQLDIFFVSSTAGVTGVAIYNVAKIFNRLTDMLAQVLQMFLVPFSSKAYAKGELDNLQVTAEKAICFSTLLFLPVFVLLFFFPEWLLELLYHGKYQDAAPVVRVFSFLTLIVPWNGVIASYLIGMNKLKVPMMLSVVHLILSFVLYYFLTDTLGFFGTSIGYVTALFITTFMIYLYLKSFVVILPQKVFSHITDVMAFVQTKIINLLK